MINYAKQFNGSQGLSGVVTLYPCQIGKSRKSSKRMDGDAWRKPGKEKGK